ncbi:MAG TPA: guanylate kinase [Herpetosiphonaceae bacterium]
MNRQHTEINPIIFGQPPEPLLVILSGPSGVGKDSALMRMRELGFPFHFVVTATDRPQRPGEINGVDYHFVTTADFEQMIADQELLEWARVYNDYKGIPKWDVRNALSSGRDVILRIDVQGVATVKKLAPEAVTIFMAPSTIGDLRQRLQWRRTDTPNQIEQRLAKAEWEMEQIHLFDYVVVNHADRLDTAVGQIRSIIFAEKQRVYPRRVKL